MTNLLQLKHNKNTIIEALANGVMLNIYEVYFFHWF